jgi:hypothetical protein
MFVILFILIFEFKVSNFFFTSYALKVIFGNFFANGIEYLTMLIKSMPPEEVVCLF